MSSLIHFGLFEVDPHNGDLRKQGRQIKLQEQPFQILLLLLEHPGEIVTRHELQKKLWQADTFVDFDRGLNRAVNRLRHALGDAADNPRFVVTIPRKGYRFAVPVERLMENAEAPSVEAPRIENPTTARSFPRWLWPLASTGALLAIVVLAVGMGTDRIRDVFSPAGSRPRIESIAVLPLENLSSDPAQDYFADGMTDEVITEIARIGSLRVISRTSIMQYKGAHRPLSVIAKELGVDAVIEGTVMRAGQKVPITAQLIRARDDRHLWAEKYERDLSDV